MHNGDAPLNAARHGSDNQSTKVRTTAREDAHQQE
jgi:hypothetical protein